MVVYRHYMPPPLAPKQQSLNLAGLLLKLRDLAADFDAAPRRTFWAPGVFQGKKWPSITPMVTWEKTWAMIWSARFCNFQEVGCNIPAVSSSQPH